MFRTVLNLVATQLDQKFRGEISDFLVFAEGVSEWLKVEKQRREDDASLEAGKLPNLEDLQMKPYFTDVVSKALNDGKRSANEPQK